MSDKKTEEKTNLFQDMLGLIGKVATEEKLTLPAILGQLTLVEHHLITSVVSHASAQSEDADKQEKKDASPDEVVGTA